MKISTTTLSFLILAAALGSHAQVIEAQELQKPLPGQLSSCSSSLHERMKLSVAAISFLLLLLLTVTLGAKTESSLRGPYHPAECCFTYVTRAIPRNRITRYYETSSQCSKPGVVFITKKDHSICADPRDDWVQDYIKELEES
ncbi:C-C motif chemokine 14 isoform X1 [Equus quagga]|uniref:C-C motif chemokine n=2 Tax=Equus TaxID=9789 RepID=F6PYM2_HORSE|nr:C-C motif chemokine 14 isoform X1 [Equus quagga]XP_046533618.1 C-C motif chemokine 14 isoform X1 [Equus quagga]